VPFGYDPLLKANTVKHRTHSLFRQSGMNYEMLPAMPEKWIALIMPKYSEMPREQHSWTVLLGFV
jgi:hypothetical protein